MHEYDGVARHSVPYGSDIATQRTGPAHEGQPARERDDYQTARRHAAPTPELTTMRASGTASMSRNPAVESVAAGVAYAALLWWASVCLVGAFRYQGLANPYWTAIPRLRTDTSGVIMFFVAAASIGISEYCRARRNGVLPGKPSTVRDPAAPSAAWASVYAACRAVLVLGTGLVCYLSLNVIVHPWSQPLQTTHLFPWPSESTLRIISLAACAISAAGLRVIAIRRASR
jgi:hypothetical protein